MFPEGEFSDREIGRRLLIYAIIRFSANRFARRLDPRRNLLGFRPVLLGAGL